MQRMLCALVAITAVLAQSLRAQSTHPAVATTLPAGWEEIDQRLVFFTVQLASVEASIDAVNKALKQAGYAQAVKQGKAEQFQKNNEMMDRQGGGPTSWKEFYGKTAQEFFFHREEQAAISIRASQERHAEGYYQKMIYTAADRPPQFDYIYRANENAEQRANAEIAKLGGKIDALIERRRQLESEQASIWAKIAFQAIVSRKIGSKPIYRFEIKINGTDDLSAQRQEALAASAAFMRTVLRATADAEGVVDKNPSATFAAFQKVVGDASSALSDRLLHAPKLALEVGDSSTLIGKIAASADRMTDVTRNISDSYNGSIQRDQADDSQKETFRAFTQSSLFDCAANISATADYIAQLSKDWNADIDVTKLFSTTAPTAIASIQAIPQKASTSASTVASEQPAPDVVQSVADGVELIGKMRGNVDRKDDGAIVIREPEQINTPAIFAPPVTFRIVAMTDSTNIRLAYAAKEIIFNWEVTPSELRVGGGPADGKNAPGAGDVPVNRWVEIVLTVLPDSMTISVDGKLRYHVSADFRKVCEPLSIFTAAGATLKIKSVSVDKDSARLMASRAPTRLSGSALEVQQARLKILNDQITSIKNWTVRGGTWRFTHDGKLHGEGDSTIDFNPDLPGNCRISFRFNVLSGMRPRMYFDGSGMYAGNEGYSKTIYAHPDGLQKHGDPVAYENGQDHRFAIEFENGRFQMTVDDHLITGMCDRADRLHLKLRAGDFWSKGSTEFWDFHVEPLIDQTSPAK